MSDASNTKKPGRFKELEWKKDVNGALRASMTSDGCQWSFSINEEEKQDEGAPVGWHLSDHVKGAYASGREKTKSMAMWRLELIFKALTTL